MLLNAKTMKFKMNQRDVLFNAQMNMLFQNFLLIEEFVILHVNIIKLIIKSIVFQLVVMIIQSKLLTNQTESNVLHHVNL